MIFYGHILCNQVVVEGSIFITQQKCKPICTNIGIVAPTDISKTRFCIDVLDIDWVKPLRGVRA